MAKYPNMQKTYADGIKDAYNDILHLIHADGYTANQISETLTQLLKLMEA